MVDRRKEGNRQIHALDPSQRLALHRYLQLGLGSGLIAVNGPPGTGVPVASALVAAVAAAEGAVLSAELGAALGGALAVAFD